MKFPYRSIGAVFTGLVLSGCATVHDRTDATSCVHRSGYRVNLLFVGFGKTESRDSEACLAAKSAALLATVPAADGGPDMKAALLAVNMSRGLSPEGRALMDDMLRQRGTSVDRMTFELKAANGELLLCEKAPVKKPDGTETMGVKCTNKVQVVQPAVTTAVQAPKR